MSKDEFCGKKPAGYQRRVKPGDGILITIGGKVAKVTIGRTMIAIEADDDFEIEAVEEPACKKRKRRFEEVKNFICVRTCDGCGDDTTKSDVTSDWLVSEKKRWWTITVCPECQKHEFYSKIKTRLEK